MEREGVLNLFYDIELPLSSVLAKMEYEGIKCDSHILDEMGIEIKKRIDQISKEIYLEDIRNIYNAYEGNLEIFIKKVEEGTL